jgi:zinc transporter ZupT
MTVVLISALAFAATLLGGVFALRFRDRLHLILGFSAGAVIGVALFDLLPESISLADGHYAPATLSLYVTAGFFAYLIIDRLILLHPHTHHDHAPDGSPPVNGGSTAEGGEGGGSSYPLHHALSRTRSRVLHLHGPPPPLRGGGTGAFGALTLAAHSFLDGVAIGAGFQASPAVGVIVAAAVVTHDFSDGINTVAFILRGGGKVRQALPWLLLDATAPVLGAASTLLFRIPQSSIGLVLAVFGGCFVYLGASDLIPESQHAHPRAATTLMTLLGAGVLFVAVRLWGG